MDDNAKVTNPQDGSVPSGPLRVAWQNVAYVLFEPFAACLIAASIFLFAASQWKSLAQANAVIQVALAVSTGILGGRVANRLAALNEGSILQARGRVAVRSLRLVFRNASSLEARVASFLKRREHIEQHPEVTVRNYEEIVEFCRLLQEETLGSIANWTDIVTEANIGPEIGKISELKSEIDSKEAEIESVRALADQRGESEREATASLETHAARTAALEAEAARLRQQLRVSVDKVGNAQSRLLDHYTHNWSMSDAESALKSLVMHSSEDAKRAAHVLAMANRSAGTSSAAAQLAAKPYSTAGDFDAEVAKVLSKLDSDVTK